MSLHIGVVLTLSRKENLTFGHLRANFVEFDVTSQKKPRAKSGAFLIDHLRNQASSFSFFSGAASSPVS
ncbi:hypothetical protein ROA7450_02679 [Roseovarius albus]|uniref:Uncharacterized protein n=1 Tax=Roseovarius albus TaxID=1247867 RepID=A0A1X6ZJQ2_9RHOB|nr:hypothetical protein ROA7450_02679 [Roseovarius albus]